jgi:hypothetical protein
MLQRSLPSVELSPYLGDARQGVRRKAQSNGGRDELHPLDEAGDGGSRQTRVNGGEAASTASGVDSIPG